MARIQRQYEILLEEIFFKLCHSWKTYRPITAQSLHSPKSLEILLFWAEKKKKGNAFYNLEISVQIFLSALLISPFLYSEGLRAYEVPVQA